MKILFLATNPATEASTRYRLLQFFPALAAAGHSPTLSTFFPLAPPARGLFKVARVVSGALRRASDLVAAHRYDLVVVHRELLPYSLNHLAGALGRRVPLVYDFDDAVWMADARGVKGLIAAPASTRALVDSAALVFAGNAFLADYARRSHDRVEIIPTIVDTALYRPPERKPRQVPVVGWIGSPTTSCYLDAVLPVLDELAKTRRFRLRIVGAGRAIRLSRVEVEAPPWRMEAEEELYRDLDIGIYPLADDRWSLGKCGFKAIQYMACGLPSVVSPVGVVRDIVRNGMDGLWAETQDEWSAALARLLDSPQERVVLGEAGRRRIEEHYSLAAIAPRVIEGLERAARRRVVGNSGAGS